MIHIEKGAVKICGTTTDIMTDITLAIAAFYDGILNKMSENEKIGTTLLMKLEIEKALHGGYSDQRVKEFDEKPTPEETLKAAEELNGLFDMLSKKKKGWRG